MVTVALSSLSPVSLNYDLDPNLTLKTQQIHFNSGLVLCRTDMFEGYSDISINKDNLLVLSDSLKLKDVVSSVSDVQLTTTDYIGSSTVALSGGNRFWNTNLDVLGTTDGAVIQTQDLFFIRPSQTSTVSASYTHAPTFFVDFTGPLMSVRDTFNQYLTFNVNTLGLTFTAGISPDANNYQHFNYLADGERVVLFTAVPSLSSNQRALCYNTTFGLLSTSTAFTTGNPITPDHVFIFGDFKTSGINNVNAVQSNWVSYDQKDQSLGIDASKSVIDTEHNLLVSAPYKNIDSNSLGVNITNLKNYLTPEYDYILSGVNPHGREYNKIISGVNQNEGYENIFLGFNSGTQAITFELDKCTYFHYASTASVHALSASTLINAGAIADKTPWHSDKIFKKQADYNKYSNWGSSSVQDGTWFCSWLSAGDTPVWMDRFFDPTYVAGSVGSMQTALLTSLGNDLITDQGNPVIWDEVSSMTFEPGCLYIYHHVGPLRNKAIVGSLKSNANLLLDVTRWGIDGAGTIVGDSVNQYKGKIFGYIQNSNQTRVDNITNGCYNINGTYGYIEGVDNIFSQDEMTISFHLTVKDWQNITGSQILGNYYNGGIGLFNNNPILTPYLTLFDPTNGYVFNLSTGYNVLNNNVFIPRGNSVKHIVKTNYDENYYIINNSRELLVYDTENILQNLIDLNSLVGGINVTKFDVDGNYDFHILDDVANRYYKISNSGVLLTSIATNSDSFGLNFDNTVRFPTNTGVINCTFNSDGVFYYVTSTHLYRNNIIIWQATDIENIVCDDADNIWVLYGRNKFAKLDSNNNLITSSETPNTNALLGARSINLFTELTPTGLKSFVLIFDNRTQYAYKYTMDGVLINSTRTAQFTNSIVTLSGLVLAGASDNGYDFQRRFVAPNMLPSGLTLKAFLKEQYFNGGTTKIALQIDTSEMSGTKHFAITFNNAKGLIKVYVDNKLAAESVFDAFKYKIASNQNVLSLAIGTNSGRRDVLINDLNQPGYYTLDGIIGDLKIFGKELDQYDVASLNVYSKIKTFNPLTWNMPTGNRNYVEEIERFFKHKMPGNKSQFFNIKLSGLDISDVSVRALIESSIKTVLKRINPVHATLYRIIWE